MRDMDLVSLGMFVSEIQRAGEKYGFYLQRADVVSPEQTEPVAEICAGSGDYAILLKNQPISEG